MRQEKSLELTKGFQVTTELWPHQANAVAFSEGKDGCMLAMDMGTGKSLTAIKIATIAKAAKGLLIVFMMSSLCLVS